MEIVNFILHIDVYLANIIAYFGVWTYAVLFFIIFAETGLVVTPFLPGDSLLFAVGVFSGVGLLNLWKVLLLLFVASILGDTVNYYIGLKFGPKIFSKENSKFLNKNYLEKTENFYKKHGGKTIILARFLPILRTFAPFVAGIGKMNYFKFIIYNIIGGFLWVSIFILLGYFFGQIPWIKNNFEYAVIIIIVISLLPLGVEYIKHRKK